MPKIKKRFYSWTQLTKDSLQLAKKLKSKKFDFIVAISRGGLVPATLLSYLLDIKKIYVIGYNYYLKPGVRGKLELTSPLNARVKNSRILLIDEISDTGQTLFSAVQLLKKRKNKVTTVTLHWKAKSKIKPDYFIHQVKNIWIVYPWDESLKKRLKNKKSC
ncbi:hypothetical protein ISS21_00525 [Patescibacteria group bacterium]|nr:hypothetical protein [Patescibacteria group bacterium]